ncbi:uncharacterized protein DEA37_0005827 [Paragonimus westermani]|uniref:Uncharacterized protein n=1 Tax=Paragonimus westermani TaxID=34504 RepID=A0A5J4NXK7_9TREM|nr:uncharacterized protein DEA37_0005827 [Paragonimus westermani]
MVNVGKCVEFTYTLGPHRLAWTTDEKDSGVWISSSLKTSLQCTAVYKRTSKILALLKRIFGRFTRQTLPSILNTYIRPTMEYAVQVWSPWLQKDIVLLQRIYHRATKLVTGLQSKPYEERIESLKLFDFCYRRIRGDLIITYNILHTPNHPLQKLFVQREPRISRTHNYLLAVPHSRGNSRRYFFAVRGSDTSGKPFLNWSYDDRPHNQAVAAMKAEGRAETATLTPAVHAVWTQAQDPESKQGLLKKQPS